MIYNLRFMIYMNHLTNYGCCHFYRYCKIFDLGFMIVKTCMYQLTVNKKQLTKCGCCQLQIVS